MTPETPTHDYGEPWRVVPLSDGGIASRDGSPIVDKLSKSHRAITCVNACAGMADPAAEIGAMREAIREAYAALDACSHNLHAAYGKLSDNADAALAKLRPFLPAQKAQAGLDGGPDLA